MQFTDEQVYRSLEALRSDALSSRRDGEGVALAEGSLVPDGLRTLVEATPAVRSAEVARVRRALEAGDDISSEMLARAVVGRLVCDRLR
jgi:CRISPR/Cas system-associated protein Csm6